jgi:hypothetical protein
VSNALRKTECQTKRVSQDRELLQACVFASDRVVRSCLLRSHLMPFSSLSCARFPPRWHFFLPLAGFARALRWQEESAVWIGKLDIEEWKISGPGVVYHFPRDPSCEIIYCNIEGEPVAARTAAALLPIPRCLLPSPPYPLSSALSRPAPKSAAASSDTGHATTAITTAMAGNHGEQILSPRSCMLAPPKLHGRAFNRGAVGGQGSCSSTSTAS